MRLQKEPHEKQHCDNPIEANQFSIYIPEGGYCWLKDSMPSPELGDENARRVGPHTHMVVKGERPTSFRRSSPLIESPDLFEQFRDLELDQDSILKFANRHGWIGEAGFVRAGARPRVAAVGIGTWHDEIQAMILASHLWNCAEAGDEPTLRSYFTWDQSLFNVQVQIGIQKRAFLTKRHPAVTGAGARPTKIEQEWLIHPNHAEQLRAIGWKRGDMVGPARLAVMNLVNPRLKAYCHPRLYLGKRSELIGHLTPDNLLGCIWLQVYQTMIGQLKLRLCTECKMPMDVSKSRSTRRMHERCSRNVRMRKWRTKQR